MQPIAMPSRSLKPAIDFLARVTTGFWPAIKVMSPTAASTFLRSPVPSPTPMLRTTLVSRGTCIGFA